MPPAIEKTEFGVTRDGLVVDRYRLLNTHAHVDVLTYGACVRSWVCKDAHGTDDIVLGYDSLEEYEACGICMGGIPGRFANRVARGRFSIDGEAFELECNDNGHHLHGGTAGFHKLVWRGRIDEGKNPAVVLTHHSADGTGGYPGNVLVSVRYSLSDENELTIDYRASTDKATIINLTNHSYFNLRGHQFAAENGVLDHLLQLHASQVLEVDNDGIPTGRLLSVKGGAFDFLTQRPLRNWINDTAAGRTLYDHCFVLDKSSVAATLYEPVTGRCLQTSTTCPGMQLYSALYVNDRTGKGGFIYGRRGSVCLEAQQFPDAPNQPAFPSAVLRPGEDWRQRTTYRLTCLN